MKLLKAILFLIPVVLVSLSLQAGSTERTVEITPDNTATLYGDVTIYSVDQVIKQVIALQDEKAKVIYLVIKSDGGSITEALRLANFLKQYNNIETISIDASSAASFIAEANPGRRLIVSNSTMMFHHASMALGQTMDVRDFNAITQLILKFDKQLASINAKRIGISYDKYIKNIDAMWFLLGEDNIKEGTADEIVRVVCSRELIESRVIKPGIDLGFFRIPASSMSACPFVN